MKELEIRKDEGSRQMIHGARRSKANMDQFGASSWHVEALVYRSKIRNIAILLNS